MGSWRRLARLVKNATDESHRIDVWVIWGNVWIGVGAIRNGRVKVSPSVVLVEVSPGRVGWHIILASPHGLVCVLIGLSVWLIVVWLIVVRLIVVLVIVRLGIALIIAVLAPCVGGAPNVLSLSGLSAEGEEHFACSSSLVVKLHNF